MKLSEKREVAKQLFLYSGLNQKEIADNLSVTEKTVSRWGTDGKWKELRGAMSSTKDELIRNTYLHIAAVQDNINSEKRAPTVSETDEILKLSKVIEILDKKVTLAQIIQVFRDFENFLMPIDAELTRKINKYHTAYINKAHNG
ncbi:MAG: hypothetical protein HC896_00095 [Bacteroidales bacterium]|nr:hypothetical protein [Bacteroidales bacterium]